jgi:glycosyltransferase involved in cell wall biosynthesis
VSLPEVAWIPNGVERPADYLPKSAGPFAGLPEPYVLFLSRIHWKKGLDRLISAWQWVPDIPLVVAGNDDEGYRPKLIELARSLGIADRVIFTGPVDDAHKWGLYESADLLVLPSYSENFGNVVAEAMTMGCPAVVSPEVGIAAFVAAHGAGIVTPGDPVPLAAAICRLLADSDARREMGRRGRDAAHRHLSWSGVVRQTEELYLRAMQLRGRRSQIFHPMSGY